MNNKLNRYKQTGTMTADIDVILKFSSVGIFDRVDHPQRIITLLVTSD